MNGAISIIAFVGEVEFAASGFVILTFASVGLLWLLPVSARRYAAKIGTYAHEISHGVVSLLTGGDWHRFHVTDQGGLCVTSGGNLRAVVAAGYVGTIVLGATFLARSAWEDTFVIMTVHILAFMIALTTLKAGDLHTAAIGTAVAALLSLSSALLPGVLPIRFLLNLLGVILVWQGAKALKSLWMISATGNNTGSDAEAMAVLAGRSPLHWAFVFSAIALVAFLAILGLVVKAGAAVS